MKILLTNLPKEKSAIQWVTPKYFMPDKSKYIPLGLISLATNIPKKYEVKILDSSNRNLSIDETIEKIEKERPDILGLSVGTFKAYQMTQVLKKTSAPYKVVGGAHATNNAEQILKQGADAVFVGQLADIDFAESIEKQPKGIIYCKTKINDIKFPDRSSIDNEYYYANGNLFKSNKRISMFSGVGCPNHCRFCDVQTKVVQRKNPEQVLEEMIYLKSIGARSIHIYEDNFNTDEDYLKQICDEIDKRDFHSEWSGRGQAKMSLETAKMLSDRGFKRIHVGIESLHDPTLRWFKKPQNYKTIKKFCDTMNKEHIDMVGFFIVGAPTETKDYRNSMARMIKDLGIKYPLFSILQPLPNTEYYNDLLKDGTYKTDFWGDFIKNPTPDFMLPFPYGEQKWKEDADFVQSLIGEFKR